MQRAKTFIAVTSAMVLVAGVPASAQATRASAADTAHAFVRAMQMSDAAKVCDLVTPEYRRSIQREWGTSCREYFRTTLPALRGARIVKVTVTGDRAVARIRSGGGAALAIRLVRRDGRWMVR
jgi:hypothetical protein